MNSYTNPFIDVVRQINGDDHQRQLHEDSPELGTIFQMKQAKMYITLSDVLIKLKNILASGEKIINLMPITNENASNTGNNGLGGMVAVHTQQGRDYIRQQNSLRDNRLLVFTNQRMIFLVLVEFIDNPQQYFSYPYDQIKKIKFKKHRASKPKKDQAPWQRQHYAWYTLDFQTEDDHVFTEMLDGYNAQLFKQNLITISGMQTIEISQHVHRRRIFDWLFSNINFSMNLYKISWIPIGIMVLIWLILMFAQHYFG